MLQSKIARLVPFLVTLTLGLPVTLNASANSLRSDLLFLLPGQCGEVGFVDVQSLRASPHYAALKQRFLPGDFRHFERFVRSLGVDLDNDVEWLAWALVPPAGDTGGELFLGLAQGQFAPERVEEYFRQQKLPLDDSDGQKMFPFGSGSGARLLFTFLDSSTAAFGPRRSLELLLETRVGRRESLLYNQTLFGRINEVNGRHPIWVILDNHYTRLALRQLLPDAAGFPEFKNVAESFHSSAVQASVERELNLNFQAWCGGPEEAQIASLLVQTGLMAKSWETQGSNPALGSVLSRAEVRTVGDRLEVELAVDEEDLPVLLARPRPL
jgi:hypothetical protein